LRLKRAAVYTGPLELGEKRRVNFTNIPCVLKNVFPPLTLYCFTYDHLVSVVNCAFQLFYSLFWMISALTSKIWFSTFLREIFHHDSHLYLHF
jgi:hypothetical protein